MDRITSQYGQARYCIQQTALKSATGLRLLTLKLIKRNPAEYVWGAGLTEFRQDTALYSITRSSHTGLCTRHKHKKTKKSQPHFISDR